MKAIDLDWKQEEGLNNYAIILAAGKGTRMNREINKVYLPLGDRPVIAHTLEAFYRAESIHRIVLVTATGEEEYIKKNILDFYPVQKPVTLVPGGSERQYSVYNGLKALPEDAEIVAIHDGARPLVTPQVIQKCVESALKWGAGVAGMPVKDTIKEADPDGRVRKTLRRESLWQVQTPQTFRYTLIMEAHRKALEDNYIATDDSALVEYLGRQVYMIPGGYDNIKITTPEDIDIAWRILKSRQGELL
jgi:2-C-methyl-D-erythritol 4-phosphate cytidylyltransferase